MVLYFDTHNTRYRYSTLVGDIMSPPRTRHKGLSDASESDSTASSVLRKRKKSESDIIYLINQIDSLKIVCSNTLSTVESLRENVENLLAENVCLKAEIRKLQESHASTSAKSEKSIANTAAQLKKISSATASTSSTSYASVVNNNPVVIIKPKDSTQTSSLTKKDIRENVSPSTTTFCGIRDAANGGIVIECNSISGSNSLLKDATDKLGDKYVITIPSKRPTKIRVIGMSEHFSSEQLKEKLRIQNPEFFPTGSVLDVVSTFKIKENFGAKLIVDTETFRKIMEDTKPRLRLGWDVCRVFEAFDIIRCFNCSDYHHLSKDCTAKKRCPKCSGEHKLLECKSIVESCCNCCEAVKSLKLNLDTNHSAMSPDCPVYIRKVNAQRQRTKYTN